MIEWAKTIQEPKLIIKRYIFSGYTLEDIMSKACDYMKQSGIDSDNIDSKFNIEITERTTKHGFYMRFHRDDYRFDENAFRRGIRDDSLWIPIYNKGKRPVMTIIWYQSIQGIDFIGGKLKFYDGYIADPMIHHAVLFDSNDLHKVTNQHTKANLTDERKVIIIKFYEK